VALHHFADREQQLLLKPPAVFHRMAGAVAEQAQIEAALGYVNEPELIHRTNLVLSQAEPG
jgi:hypothetical protein